MRNKDHTLSVLLALLAVCVAMWMTGANIVYSQDAEMARILLNLGFIGTVVFACLSLITWLRQDVSEPTVSPDEQRIRFRAQAEAAIPKLVGRLPTAAEFADLYDAANKSHIALIGRDPLEQLSKEFVEAIHQCAAYADQIDRIDKKAERIGRHHERDVDDRLQLVHDLNLARENAQAVAYRILREVVT